MKKPVGKTTTFTVRFDPKEKKKLRNMAKRFGYSPSALVCRYIREGLNRDWEGLGSDERMMKRISELRDQIDERMNEYRDEVFENFQRELSERYFDEWREEHEEDPPEAVLEGIERRAEEEAISLAEEATERFYEKLRERAGS